MAKGYWVAHIDVADAEVYDQYRAANAAPFKEYGARFIVRGGHQEVQEGSVRKRTVVIEFDSFQDAVACYNSEGYQAAKAIRDPVSTGELVIVEGYDL